jgi:DNA-binding CsgD family transcriptional regulator
MDGLESARQEALRIGVLALAYETTCALALADVQQCRFEVAENRIREGLADASRLRLGRAVSMLRMAEAVLYAHQGRRAEMAKALDELAPVIDNAPGVRPASYGLARAICSLLEEDQRTADQEFAQALAYDAENPAAGEFGKHGIVLLLGVLAGRVGWQHYAAVTRLSASGTRWNQQFVRMAHAILLGRDGRTDEATAVAAAALEAAEIYPMARNLCLRLVGRTAYDDGWGDPVEWLRQAEEYFHGAGIPMVASACRALLRGMGAPVRQRRAGVEQVPPGLRRAGVTFREFEVAKLMAERFGNKDIALRLHISPRTVEKHVASVLQKTGCLDRAAFVEAARDLLTE